METTGEYYHQLDPYPLILPATLARLYAVLAIDPQVRVQLRCCGALDVHIFDEQLDRLIEDDGVCDEDPVSPVAKCTSCLTECQLDEEAALCDDSRCTISELLLMFMSKKIRKMGIMRIEQIE